MNEQFPVPIEIIDRAFEAYQQENDQSKVDIFLKIYIQINNFQRIQQCLELGADPNQIITLILGVDEYKRKVPIFLHAYESAIKKNDFTIPNIMLKYRPDVNLFAQRESVDDQNSWYETENALFRIVGSRDGISLPTKIEQIQLLIDHGADVNQPNDEGWTPLSRVNEKEVYDFLIQNGADVNYVKKDKWGAWNRLMIAVFNVNVEETKWLLEHGINLDFIGEDDFEGTISGTPHGPVDIFSFIDYTNHDNVCDIIIEFLDQRERKRIEENPLLKRLPLPPRLKIIGYLLHSRSTLSENDFIYFD